jgi:hypothetical protein
MEANTSTVMMLPLQGDYAAGVRTKPEALRVRGNFATSMSGSSPLARHHGDFAAGLRSHLHLHLHHPGDFARGLRAGESTAPA